MAGRYTKTNLRTGVENAAPAFGMPAAIEARFAMDAEMSPGWWSD